MTSYEHSDQRALDRRSQSDFGSGSDISNDSIEKKGDPTAHFEHQQHRWLAELKARHAEIVQVST